MDGLDHETLGNGSLIWTSIGMAPSFSPFFLPFFAVYNDGVCLYVRTCTCVFGSVLPGDECCTVVSFLRRSLPSF